MVSPDAIGFASPPPETLLSNIPRHHPRVLAGLDSLNVFRKSTVALPDAQVIIREAGELLGEPVMNESEGEREIRGKRDFRDKKLAMRASMKISNFMYGAIDHFCKAWILTGDNKYAGGAIRFGMEVASWDPEGLTALSDFGDARCMLATALVFDTFHDRLTARSAICTC